MSNKTYELDNFPTWVREDWQKWYDVARSYRRACKILLDAEVPDRHSYSERDVLPILNLLRHYAELVIKCFLSRSGDLALGSHNLAALKQRLDKIHPDLFSADVWAFLQFLNSVDTTGSALRYPVDMSNQQFFTDASGRHTIDLAYLYPVARRMFADVAKFVGEPEVA
jgi:hypothetical protein